MSNWHVSGLPNLVAHTKPFVVRNGIFAAWTNIAFKVYIGSFGATIILSNNASLSLALACNDLDRQTLVKPMFFTSTCSKNDMIEIATARNPLLNMHFFEFADVSGHIWL